MASPDFDRQFDTTIEIDAPRELVWRALSEASELERWFAPEAQVTPGVGGSVRWTWPQLHDWPQTIEVWEDGRRLLTRYDSPVDDGEGGKLPLFIEFSLQGEGGRTTLRLVHSGFGPGADFDGEFDGISRGWMVELQSLRLYLEQHAGQQRQLVSIMRTIDIEHDEAWRRLTGPNGLACGADIDQTPAGSPFSIGPFEGQALQCHRREFSGRVTNLDDAWLRFIVEDCNGKSFAWLCLAQYGQAPEQLASIEADFEALMERLFASEGARA